MMEIYLRSLIESKFWARDIIKWSEHATYRHGVLSVL